MEAVREPVSAGLGCWQTSEARAGGCYAPPPPPPS
eukprot:COSAG03_NODE_1341_length_4293_cov_3.534684_4_plen_34_part_01